MLKKLTVLMLAALLLMLLIVPASAEELLYVSVDTLNIRSAPNTDSDIIGQAKYRDSLQVLSCEGSWFKIYYWGVTGYICGDYVSCSQPPSLNPTQGEKIVEYAKTFVGVPYVYGGSSPSGFDCSGFVKYVYAQFGIELPRTSYSQASIGTGVSREQLVPGDLVLFRGAGHVGIYCGNNTYIHAPQTGRTVSVDEMNRSVYCARRIVF